MTADADVGARRVGDNPFDGIWQALLAYIIFSCQDALSKFLVTDYSAAELLWCRYAINMVILAPFLWRARGTIPVGPIPWIQIARGIAVTASALIYTTGLRWMPLADATAINFASPLLVVVLSILLLREKVGVHVWAAVAAGVLGILLIIRPGTSSFNAAALLPLISAMFWSTGMILTRRIKRSAPALTTLTYSTGIGLVAMTLILPFTWKPLTLEAIVVLLGIGLISAVGQYMMILAYARRLASIVAPFTYTQLIWSSILGALIFGSVPELYTWIGGAVVVVSGLYVLHRERKTSVPA